MSVSEPVHHFSLQSSDNKILATLCGQFDTNIKQIEKYFDTKIMHRAGDFTVFGGKKLTHKVEAVVQDLYAHVVDGEELDTVAVHIALQHLSQKKGEADEIMTIRTPRAKVRLRNPRQQAYARNIISHDINFAIGPAGTGKTYIAVACAVEALEKEEVSRIVLVRPAVEAGERLGFLPGDLEQKVDPYLRPLYDALYEMLGFERVDRLLERHIIEIAPLAYMRGRTLNDAMAILDEAQNTTEEQMRMFLTRIGCGSRAIITGDVTQTDLPRSQRSGLVHAIDVLSGISEIKFNYFYSTDVVRHPLVQKIVEAYQLVDEKKISGANGDVAED
ncbi:phoH-like protein [bacterium BMS3Bbin11]|nr:phoH-like protein [bacterium BMS3Bbin11]GMT40661.1 MAG: PhoH family protein [bacterium]HDH15357.1 PhoH family protein [Gammaproteobacteria bacterium]